MIKRNELPFTYTFLHLIERSGFVLIEVVLVLNRLHETSRQPLLELRVKATCIPGTSSPISSTYIDRVAKGEETCDYFENERQN